MHKEKRNVSEEMRRAYTCGLEKFSTLDGRGKTFAVAGEVWGPHAAI